MTKQMQTDLKILYLEDEEQVRDMIVETLEYQSIHVESFSNAVDALKFVDENEVDIVITDIKMPKMDGLEFVHTLKRRWKDLPVIIISAFAESNYLQKALELNVEKFLNKPIDIDYFVKILEDLIESVKNKNDLKKKKLQLENYKKAIYLTSLVLEVQADGTIINVSNTLREFMNEHVEGEVVFDNLDNFGKYYNYVDSNFTSRDKIRLEMFEKVNNHEIFSKDIYLTIHEKEFVFNMMAFASSFSGNKVESFTLILKDLTKSIEVKDKTINELYRDFVTKLPNRNALDKELENASELILTIVSVDDFDKLRYTYGFKAINEIMLQVGTELENIWTSKEFPDRKIFKVEKDSFVLTRNKKEDENMAWLKVNFPNNQEDFSIFLAKKIANDITDHFANFVVTTNEIQVDVNLTLGGSCDGKTDLLHEAMIALDIAKKSKKNFVCYKELINPKDFYKKNIEMQHKLRLALETDGIITHFQPIVDSDGKIIKYEALARVIDYKDKSNIIRPCEFLEIMQNSKNYEKFTKTVIKKALEGSMALNTPVSINLSFQDITNQEIIEFLVKVLQNCSHEITLEFLESEGIQDLKKTKEFCELMKSYGAKIAIDDFGSGYSNYNYLLEIPFDVLKLDGILIKKADDYKGYLLLESIVNFARTLDVDIVAEFVESKKSLNILKGLKINQFQGYYFGKPKSISEILENKISL